MATVWFSNPAFAVSEEEQIRHAVERLPREWRVIVGDPASALFDVTVHGPGFISVQCFKNRAADAVVRFIESFPR